jgi:hypothetical protein
MMVTLTSSDGDVTKHNVVEMNENSQQVILTDFPETKNAKDVHAKVTCWPGGMTP